MRRLNADWTMKGYIRSYFPKLEAVSYILKQPWKLWLIAAAIGLTAPAWPATPQSAPARQEDPSALEAALQLYSALLLQTAQGRRSYPAAALEQKLSGSVQIEISIGADGKLKEQSVIASSHHRVLDEHALRLMELAVPLTAIPSALHGRAFRVPVRVNYVIPE